MEMSDLLQEGVKLFKNNIGDQANNVDDNSIMNALGELLSNNEGNFDLSHIISSLSDGGIGKIISSWIGTGENEPVDGNTLANILGSDQISSFAKKLGIDPNTAAEGLSGAIPNIVDKATPDGSTSLLDSIGGLNGLMDMAGSFFGGKS